MMQMVKYTFYYIMDTHATDTFSGCTENKDNNIGTITITMFTIAYYKIVIIMWKIFTADILRIGIPYFFCIMIQYKLQYF